MSSFDTYHRSIEGIALYDYFVHLNLKNDNAWAMLAINYSEIGDIKAWKKAISINPENIYITALAELEKEK